MMRKWLVVLVCGLLAAAAQAAIEVRDDRGVTVRLEKPPQRIVTLLPSLTETVCALGDCARLVGTDRFSDWPAQVQALPKAGGLEDANLERIVALKPDLVLAASSARVLERLEALGLKVAALEPKNHADMRRVLDAVARLLGRPDADALWTRIERDTAQAAARVPAGWRGKRVYFEVDAGPYAAGPVSFIGETIGRLGLGNIVPPEMGPFPKLNPEFVVRAKPDLVVGSRREVDEMAARPGWSAMAALREGRTCRFERAQADMLVRPGPRLGEAAALLADCLARLEPPR
jgi:iron complex transport system substrate-binding protein